MTNRKPKARKPTKKARRPRWLKLPGLECATEDIGSLYIMWFDGQCELELKDAKRLHAWLGRAIAYLEAQKRGGS